MLLRGTIATPESNPQQSSDKTSDIVATSTRIELILKHGIPTTDPIILAILNNNELSLRALLSDNPLNIEAVMIAIYKRYLNKKKIVSHIDDYLKENGSSIINCNINGITPLHLATQADDLTTVSYLIRNNAKIMLTAKGVAPIELATSQAIFDELQQYMNTLNAVNNVNNINNNNNHDNNANADEDEDLDVNSNEEDDDENMDIDSNENMDNDEDDDDNDENLAQQQQLNMAQQFSELPLGSVLLSSNGAQIFSPQVSNPQIQPDLPPNTDPHFTPSMFFA